ncbi:MAG: hypothetical protein A2161_07765 [Candidatus Schekmanbacteria bacterium RBG_13_48_7]|uniref:DUF2304 domain-containing protein n=1 Tax=Candidatus Schekmanbacteria bacterium RBG_13_48_7 TaxID=1817878 RepID=A0A1F7RXQ7_9BACT|nr:MAG: hypothetical protein A2161_07765 [Candidatus Schekmanbacteria bacterium RBG_13_48_7]
MLSFKLQLVMIFLSFFIVGYIIHLIREEIIELKYSITWIFIGLILIVISIKPDIVTWIAQLLGIGLTVNALFLISLIFTLILMMVLVIAISKLSMKCSRLTQTIALLKDRISELEKKDNKIG